MYIPPKKIVKTKINTGIVKSGHFFSMMTPDFNYLSTQNQELHSPVPFPALPGIAFPGPPTAAAYV
jgi:hypothetical protein